jgi:hypothetical protein
MIRTYIVADNSYKFTDDINIVSIIRSDRSRFKINDYDIINILNDNKSAEIRYLNEHINNKILILIGNRLYVYANDGNLSYGVYDI